MGRNKNFSREEVLMKAVQIFWKKGYSDTSLSDLEKATGVNKSGLYSEFKDKDDIFYESIRYYCTQSPMTEILERKPLGWQNIEEALLSRMSCSGQKGCFVANTMREYSIIPAKVKMAMQENSEMLFELFNKNLKAAGVKNSDAITKLILTFASGISLKLNAIKPEELNEEVKSFLTLLK